MKFSQDRDGCTEVTHDSRIMANFFLVGCLFFAGKAIFHFISGSTGGEYFVGSIGASAFFIVGYLVIYEHGRFVFDTARREIRWRRRTIFSRQSGKVPFDQVDAVIADAMVDTDDVTTRRLALRTRGGLIPLTRMFRSDSGGGIARAAAELNTLVGRSSTPGNADGIDRLIASGQDFAAIRQLRAQRGISLREAKDEIADRRSSARATAPGTNRAATAHDSAPRDRVPTEAIAALARGSKIDAIKVVREHNGIGLKDAKDIIDHYVAKHPDIQSRLALANSERIRNAISAVLLITALAMLAYYIMHR